MTTGALLHSHRVQIRSANVLRLAWPRKAAALLMVAVGLAFVVITLIANLFSVGPAFDRMTGSFRPIMTQQAIQADQQSVSGLASAGTEIQTKLIPTLALQLNVSPAQLQAQLAQQYPAVTNGLSQIPAITQNFSGLIATLDRTRPLFASADAIPTSSIPAASVPWSLLAVGVVTIGVGTFVWFVPAKSARRRTAVIATILGAALIAAPLSLNMVTKASNADQMNTLLKPVYNAQLVSQANGALTTLGAMGTQMQQAMIPQLATQLHMTPVQLNTMFVQNFPATAAALNGLPASMTRFHDLVNRFDRNLSNYNTLKPVSFEPIVWSMVIGGIALFVLGGAGVAVTRGKGPSAGR